jgi:hypothetical protein
MVLVVLMTIVRGGFPEWSRTNSVTNQPHCNQRKANYPETSLPTENMYVGQPSATLTFRPIHIQSDAEKEKTKEPSSSTWALPCTVHTR